MLQGNPPSRHDRASVVFSNAARCSNVARQHVLHNHDCKPPFVESTEDSNLNFCTHDALIQEGIEAHESTIKSVCVQCAPSQKF